ncbi:MAG TPA: VOC family protein [Caldimonas sp.]|jgi:hypothetical protein|nr:VOC family protein [Caldimonas sp.]HEX2542715.1 VOC family protein [Caldimonas sp.]
MPLRLDHVIYAGRDLDTLMSGFAALTGVAPVRGGRHPGLGTRNALASLGDDVYFELLAVDPEQATALAGTLGGRIDALPSPRLLAYMLKGAGLERQQEILARHGIASDLFDASRNTPDGRTLRWRLLVPRDNAWGDWVPKFIDWLDTVHPATTSVPGCRLETFEMGHPDAARLNELLAELGADLVAQTADQPFFQLRLQTPRGRVSFVG